MSELHHNKISCFNRLCASTYANRNRPNRSNKWITYPLNILFGFACIEFLRIAFGFLQEHLSQLDLQNCFGGIETEDPLTAQLMDLIAFYKNLTNLYEKVLCNSKVNLEKYIAEVEKPFSLTLS